MIKQLLLIPTLLLVNFQNHTTPKRPLILFERVFVNPKDAFSIRGETIDGLGSIHSFNNRNNKPGVKYREWNLGRKDFQPFNWEMTPAEVEKNLILTDSVVGIIPRDTLSKYIRLLSIIAESNKDFESTLVVCKTSSVSNVPPDASTLYGFIYDSNSSMYKRIKIEYHTGVEWHNQSEYIDQFIQWKW